MGALPKPSDWSKDPWVKFGGRFQSIEDRLAKLETARSFVFVPAQVDINSTNLPVGSYGLVTSTSVPVPSGYSQAVILCFASAGVTSSSTTSPPGNTIVGVQPVVHGATEAISNGVPGPGSVSAVAFLSVDATDLVDGTSINFDVYAYANAASPTTITANTGNVHLSAAVLFRR